MQFPRFMGLCESLLRAFNRNDVEFMIIGSMARSHYRPVDSVSDMDLLINPTEGNVSKMKTALAAVGIRVTSPIEECVLPGRRVPCIYGYEHYADVLTPKPRFSYCKASPRSIEVQVCDDIRARIASERDLDVLDALREQSERDEKQSDPGGDKSEITQVG